MFPVVFLGRLLVLPIQVLVLLDLPKHQVHQNLLQQRGNDLLGGIELLLVADAVLVRNDEICQKFGEILKLLDLEVQFVEDAVVSLQVVADVVVDLWDL